MTADEAYKWAESLEFQQMWRWWYFQSKQALDGPYWYVEAINKINGKKRKLWKEGDERALLGRELHTGNINDSMEACVTLARKIETIWSHLKCGFPKERIEKSSINTSIEEEITDDDFDTLLGLARIKFIEIVRTAYSYFKGELSSNTAIRVIVKRSKDALKQINQTEKEDKQ